MGFGLQGQEQQLAAANQLAGLSSAYDANQRGDIQSQADLGASLRGVDQDQRQAPVTSTQQLVAMLSGLPIGLFTGQQTNATSKTTSSQDSINANIGFTKP